MSHNSFESDLINKKKEGMALNSNSRREDALWRATIKILIRKRLDWLDNRKESTHSPGTKRREEDQRRYMIKILESKDDTNREEIFKWISNLT